MNEKIKKELNDNTKTQSESNSQNKENQNEKSKTISLRNFIGMMNAIKAAQSKEKQISSDQKDNSQPKRHESLFQRNPKILEETLQEFKRLSEQRKAEKLAEEKTQDNSFKDQIQKENYSEEVIRAVKNLKFLRKAMHEKLNNQPNSNQSQDPQK